MVVQQVLVVRAVKVDVRQHVIQVARGNAQLVAVEKVVDQTQVVMDHVNQRVQAVQLIVEQLVQVDVTQVVQVVAVKDAKGHVKIPVQAVA